MAVVESSIELTVVVPCYNEEENIEPLLIELETALRATGKTFEIIYVDDCSTDQSLRRLCDAAKRRPHLRILKHTRNLGESAAIFSGYEVARGAIVFSMDADLQNDPADIPKFLEGLKEADAVCGVRARRQDSLTKKLSSRIANKVRALLLKDNIHDAGCTYRAIRREALAQLIAFRGLHRFIPTILRCHGFRVTEIPVNHRPRTRGYSKYGIGNRLWVGILDIIGMMWYRKRHFPPHRAVEIDVERL
ncbi:MAG: glycosyltransferase family 2 protein [Candidatus Sumerlaeaceae bacterium]|nr:glycosyltransferase family 2 protein [Candidatus Sumerlaeaceae bacterium]